MDLVCEWPMNLVPGMVEANPAQSDGTGILGNLKNISFCIFCLAEYSKASQDTSTSSLISAN
jgi:hypothetical protein